MSDVADPLAPPPRRRWLRFSLASLLWAVVLVSLLVTNVLMGIRLRRAESENQELRREFGVFTIKDPQKINVLGVRTHEQWGYCWRIYLPPLPPGCCYFLCTANREIPATGLPKKWTRQGLDGGKGLVYAGIKRKADDHATSYIEYHTERGDRLYNTDVPTPDWTQGGWNLGSDVVLAGNTVVGSPGKPLVLMRLRVSDDSGPSTPPCDGFMVWIETYHHTPGGRAPSVSASTSPPETSTP